MARMTTAPQIVGTPRVVSTARAMLGEGCCWSMREQALYWVDILGQRLLRVQWNEAAAAAPPQAAYEEWAFSETISAVAERQTRAGLIIALRRGPALFNPQDRQLTRLAEPEPDRPGNRFNDGKCDTRGRFWGGTMDFHGRAPSGALYRFDPEGAVERVADLGWPVTNGPTWSLDGTSLFLNDSVHRRVVVFDFDAHQGLLSRPHEWLQFSAKDGCPDGMTTDADGRLWIAHWGGSCVTCRDPETGAELLRIALPTAHITNATFGGPQLSTLFITSARHGIEAHELATQPLAGALFAVELNVRGQAAGVFAG